MTNLLL